MIPALWCGVAGVDLETGARISGKTIADHEPPPLSEVRFIAYSDAEFETVRKATAGFRGDR